MLRWVEVQQRASRGSIAVDQQIAVLVEATTGTMDLCLCASYTRRRGPEVTMICTNKCSLLHLPMYGNGLASRDSGLASLQTMPVRHSYSLGWSGASPVHVRCDDA